MLDFANRSLGYQNVEAIPYREAEQDVWLPPFGRGSFDAAVLTQDILTPADWILAV